MSSAGTGRPRWRATALVQESLHEFCTTDAWRHSERAPHLSALPPAGFVCSEDYLTPEQLERDSVRKNLQELGLGPQLGTMIPMPSGETVCFTAERRIEDGRHGPAAVAALDSLRPHLARAGLLSARLGLEKAQMAVATLEAIGLPAAVLAVSGRVLAANALLEASSAILFAAAHGGLAIGNPAANKLFREAILDNQSGRGSPVRSIPVPASEEHPAVIVHVLPLRGAAHDIFNGAATLLVVTAVGMSEMAPGAALLHGLFDLSPAEARLATALASGRSLKEAGADARIQFSTARSYLDNIFRKTGTRQQSQLVALLKSTQPLFRRQDGASRDRARRRSAP